MSHHFHKDWDGIYLELRQTKMFKINTSLMGLEFPKKINFQSAKEMFEIQYDITGNDLFHIKTPNFQFGLDMLIFVKIFSL